MQMIQEKIKEELAEKERQYILSVIARVERGDDDALGRGFLRGWKDMLLILCENLPKEEASELQQRYLSAVDSRFK